MERDHRYLADVAAEVEIPVDGIISRTLHTDDDVKVVLFGFDRGQELSEHTASMPAIVHILSGEARLTLGSETREAKAGAWAYMAPDLPHSIYAHTPLVMLLTMIKAARKSRMDEK